MMEKPVLSWCIFPFKVNKNKTVPVSSNDVNEKTNIPDSGIPSWGHECMLQQMPPLETDLLSNTCQSDATWSELKHIGTRLGRCSNAEKHFEKLQLHISMS